MKRYILYVIITITSIQGLLAQIPEPVKDDAKFYQIRASEVGPWEFRPKYWYYSKWKEKGEWWNLWLWTTKYGVGFHDQGVAGTRVGPYDNYINDYKPNKIPRGIMLSTTEMALKEYRDKKEEMVKVQNRTLIDIADRKLDIMDSSFDAKFNKLVRLCNEEIKTYQELGGDAYEFELTIKHISRKNKFIKGEYVRNTSRTEVYNNSCQELEQLRLKLRGLNRRMYSSKELSKIKKIDKAPNTMPYEIVTDITNQFSK